MKNSSLAVLLAVSFSGCVHYMPAAVSSTSIGSKYEVPVKTVIGTSSAYYVFGFGPTGDDSLAAAIEDAKSEAPSDSIANVFIDRKLTCFPVCGFSIFTRIDTIVYGTLVKYTDADGMPIMAQLVGKTPRQSIAPVASENQSGKECYTYDCLSVLAQDDMKIRYEAMTEYERAKIISEAHKKVRKCYPEKDSNNIVVPPEARVWEGERQLLEYLCKTGALD